MAKTPDTCPRCGVGIRAGLLACKSDWYALPAGIRARINEYFVPKQTALTATGEYRDAYRDAMRWYREHPISDQLRDQLAASLDHARRQR